LALKTWPAEVKNPLVHCN